MKVLAAQLMLDFHPGCAGFARHRLKKDREQLQHAVSNMTKSELNLHLWKRPCELDCGLYFLEVIIL